MKTIEEQAIALLERCEVVTLASIDAAGCPRPVPMSKIRTEGFSTVWMATGGDSVKTADFRRNPRAGLCYAADGDSVVLTGRVEVIADEGVKREMWQEWFIDHFDKGPSDPNYVLLKFSGEGATFWIDGVFIHK